MSSSSVLINADYTSRLYNELLFWLPFIPFFALQFSKQPSDLVTDLNIQTETSERWILH